VRKNAIAAPTVQSCRKGEKSYLRALGEGGRRVRASADRGVFFRKAAAATFQGGIAPGRGVGEIEGGSPVPE